MPVVSTLTTSAPISASMPVQNGPARMRVRSTTRIPDNGTRSAPRIYWQFCFALYTASRRKPGSAYRRPRRLKNGSRLSPGHRMRDAAAMPEPTTHFTFSDSFTGSLKQALKQAGRADAVFCFLDDLSFGPINPPDPASRLEWIDRELFVDFGDRAAEIKRLNAFWTTAQTAERRLVWVSKRVARERADFLEWVWRMGNAPYQVVEFDEADVTFQ